MSHWQGYVNWRLVAASGIDFAVAKASEGRGYTDDWYARNAAHARASGIRFTAYHYARPDFGRFDAASEAVFFVKQARLTDRDLVPALDLEESGHLGPKALQRWALTWLRRVESLIGVKPMVYTSPGFWRYRLDNTPAIARAGFQVLWVGHWDTSYPSVPGKHWAGNGWTIWQWTDCGHVPGVHGCVDRDSLGGARLRDLTIGHILRHGAG